MDRRAFIAGTLSLLSAPLAAEGQPSGKGDGPAPAGSPHDS
jgi:hypothetical protein